MDMLLIPGLWLDASSWDDVVPSLSDAGHTPHALTLPPHLDADVQTWVDAVVAAIDARPEPVVLVGHSGGGNIAWGAAAARADRVARVIFVDTVPPPPGGIVSEFPVVDGVIPFPGWDFFDEVDVADLDALTRERTAAQTVPVPAEVPTTPLGLTDAARHGVPVTVLSGAFDESGLEAALEGWGAYGDEWRSIADREVVHLDSGHWPQFSQPQRLAAAIIRAVG